MPTPSPYPAPVSRSNYVHQIRYDGEFYEDDLPPELFDDEEDVEELAVYAHIAAHIDE